MRSNVLLLSALAAGVALLSGCTTDGASSTVGASAGSPSVVRTTGTDPNLVGKYFERTANQGNTRSQLKLADSYYSGINGFSRDRTKAAEFYKKAADGGIKVAASKYADMLASGDGVAADPQEAIRYMSMDTDNKNGWAEVKLARAYADSDPAKARALLQSAVSKGNKVAAKELAALG